MNPRYHQRLQHARARIARSRRRMDRSAARWAMRAQMAFDWKALITRRPLALILGAVGLGVAASAFLKRTGGAGTFGDWSRLWNDLIASLTGRDAHDESGDVETTDDESADDSKE